MGAFAESQNQIDAVKIILVAWLAEYDVSVTVDRSLADLISLLEIASGQTGMRTILPRNDDKVLIGGYKPLVAGSVTTSTGFLWAYRPMISLSNGSCLFGNALVETVQVYWPNEAINITNPVVTIYRLTAKDKSAIVKIASSAAVMTVNSHIATFTLNTPIQGDTGDFIGLSGDAISGSPDFLHHELAYTGGAETNEFLAFTLGDTSFGFSDPVLYPTCGAFRVLMTGQAPDMICTGENASGLVFNDPITDPDDGWITKDPASELIFKSYNVPPVGPFPFYYPYDPTQIPIYATCNTLGLTYQNIGSFFEYVGEVIEGVPQPNTMVGRLQLDVFDKHPSYVYMHFGWHEITRFQTVCQNYLTTIPAALEWILTQCEDSGIIPIIASNTPTLYSGAVVTISNGGGVNPAIVTLQPANSTGAAPNFYDYAYFATGRRFNFNKLASDGFPSGVADVDSYHAFSINYYIERINNTTFYFHDTYENAMAGNNSTRIKTSSAGSGLFYIPTDFAYAGSIYEPFRGEESYRLSAALKTVVDQHPSAIWIDLNVLGRLTTGPRGLPMYAADRLDVTDGLHLSRQGNLKVSMEVMKQFLFIT